ncbi:Calcitonin gene-related peptide [Larimichthys crocea]|uniref:Calcitonin gene-related peptide n=2 Tax=Larimichthys crocea TaxID=215358 RepID=A0A6G0IZ04_LARCR|nr:calcitonin gene-related peptide 2 isoform X2 [Larimichthys crocea]KAE8296755.1 Calcitonin gene-related peptide [Larimichthys crocea]
MWVKASLPLWKVTGSVFSFLLLLLPSSSRGSDTYFINGTMVMLKISAFLVAYALVICQMYCSQAAPARPGLESMSDRVTLTDYEARRLLNAIVKEFVQMTAEELEQQETEGNSVTAQKRACNTATCVTHRLADFLSRSGGMGNSNFVPTNVGAKAFGRRRRNVQM